MSEIAFLLQALDGFVLLPIWTLTMGCKLYNASASTASALMDRDGDRQSLELASTDNRA